MQSTSLSEPEVDAELCRVFEKHAAYKSPQCKRVACAIIKQAMRSAGSVWPDDEMLMEVIKTLVGDDKNCVGTAWRWLGKLRIITQTGEHRKSNSKAAKGHRIFEWHLANWQLARVFLKRNDQAYEPSQRELFT